MQSFDVLFSPLFTILSRLFIPLFLFDTSGICFMCMAVCFVVLGCLSLARLADKIGLSRFLVGKECLLNTDLSHEITFSLKRGFAFLKDILL